MRVFAYFFGHLMLMAAWSQPKSYPLGFFLLGISGAVLTLFGLRGIIKEETK